MVKYKTCLSWVNEILFDDRDDHVGEGGVRWGCFHAETDIDG